MNVGMDLDPDACYRALETRDARFDGRLFVGVTSTGIYCRPICPARTPKRANVRFFASAAAAEAAGFRACLRCRPEVVARLRAPGAAPSHTVARALAPDRGRARWTAPTSRRSPERLGRRRAAARRLFRQHLGASPVQVAQTRRVLLAKQLIHDTSLSMAEVALAVRLRQRAPVQRDLPAPLPPPAGVAAPPEPARTPRRMR